MEPRIRHDLLSLESRDVVQQRFKRIHSRDLSARRAREINAAAKQAREYFRNSRNADHLVRPLLTFYGVASLTRALVLLLRAKGGEECLTPRHGLERVGWAEAMSGSTSEGLRNLRQLKIRRRRGLFSDLVEHTQNRVLLHVTSTAVEGSIPYNTPDTAEGISVDDLFSRIPDLRQEYSILCDLLQYTLVDHLSFTSKDRLMVKVYEKDFVGLSDYFTSQGYTSSLDGKWCVLSCDAETAQKVSPLFIHTYLDKQFGRIHRLYMAEPFPGGACYSQLCITYMVSFILGMLARYYPTHWMALINGSKGDSIWPAMSRAQEVVEHTYPELVAEFISWTITENSEAQAVLPTVLDENRVK